MPIKRKNSDTLPVKRDDRSSRFVVDLRRHEEYQEKNSADKKIYNIFWNTIFKIKDKKLSLNYNLTDWATIKNNLRKFLKDQQEIKPIFKDYGRGKNRKNNLLESAINIYAKIQEKFFDVRRWRNKKTKKIENLAFFSIVKMLGFLLFSVIKAFYKIFYFFGWITVFTVRFVFFFFQRIFSTLAQKFVLARKIFLGAIIFFNTTFFVLSWIIFLPVKIFHKTEKKHHALFSHLRNKLPKPKKISVRKHLPSFNFKIPLFKIKKTNKIRSFFGFFNKKIKIPRIKIYKTKYFSLPFALFLIFISIPFLGLSYYKSLNYTEDRVLGVAEAAVNDLQGASDSILGMDFSQAGRNFSQASANFLKAEKELGKVNNFLFSLAALSDNKKAQLASQAEDVVAAGKAASNLGADISAALDSLFNSSEKDVLEIIDNFIYYGQSARLEANKLNQLLGEIDIENLPAEYQEQFSILKKQAVYIEEGLNDFLSIAQKLDDFLGANMDKRYLLVFQNNTELRATGGFIGSFALIDFKNGKIDNLEVPEGGSYDTEGGLKKLIAAPEPLRLVNPLWHFWDANWWPDWPRSAEKLMWFYEKSDGSTVDGVISFTPTVLEKILNSLGPIDMSEEYGVVIDEDNFWITVQQIVEEKPSMENTEDNEDKEKISENNKPKKIIGDLMDKIIAELPERLNRKTLIDLFNALEESLREKHILFYVTDDDLQEEIDERGWSGRIKKTGSNYLSVINTNIAGGKSDKKIKEIINHKTEILPSGEIINTLLIKRTHTGEKREIFSGVRNVNWMRIYVPWGSKLIEARGFSAPDDIYFEEADPEWEQDEHIVNAKETERMHEESGTLVYDELGKTVFANWSMVDPGESAVIYLKYKLPFTFKDRNEKLIDKIKKLINPSYNKYYPYSLYVQKQAGAMPSELNTSLSILGDHDVVWRYPDNLNITSTGWQTNTKLNEDKHQSVLLAK